VVALRFAQALIALSFGLSLPPFVLAQTAPPAGRQRVKAVLIDQQSFIRFNEGQLVAGAQAAFCQDTCGDNKLAFGINNQLSVIIYLTQA
jgi:hypothetical protein